MARRRRATFALLVVAALVLALVASLTQPADAQQAQRGIERVCPAPDDRVPTAPAQPTDLDPTHGAALACAAEYGLLDGLYPGGLVRPGQQIRRDETAAIVRRWIETATNIALQEPEPSRFSDLDGNPHRRAIEALAAANILGGRADGSFGPADPLTRGQFARIVANAISYADVFATDGPLPPSGDAPFVDTINSVFAADIGRLAAAGVVHGGPTGAFRPGAWLTRGQTVSLMMRAADYLDRHQRWWPTAQAVPLNVTLRGADVVGGGEENAMAYASLFVDAFDGTIVYTVYYGFSSLGPLGGGDGLAIRRGGPGENGPVVVVLADGERLDGAGYLSGVAREVDSTMRFADLLEDRHNAHLVLGSDRHPAGAVRGQLGPAPS